VASVRQAAMLMRTQPEAQKIIFRASLDALSNGAAPMLKFPHGGSTWLTAGICPALDGWRRLFRMKKSI